MANFPLGQGFTRATQLPFLFSERLTVSGDPDLGQDFLVEQYAEIRPPADQTQLLWGVRIMIQDNSKFGAEIYGGGSALINGIRVTIVEGTGAGATVLMDLTTNFPVKRNADWEQLTGNGKHLDYGAGDEFLIVDWDFGDKQGAPIKLDGSKDQAFRFTLDDDFSGLTGHNAVCIGNFI